MQLTGIHHLTAVSASIRENFRFYTDVMGFELVRVDARGQADVERGVDAVDEPVA